MSVGILREWLGPDGKSWVIDPECAKVIVAAFERCRAKSYEKGFRAAREAAAKVCDTVALSTASSCAANAAACIRKLINDTPGPSVADATQPGDET